ncbi:hypothetical protein [Burkholderia cepacia]|uniref:hypothetical protein n=1 Tax=Burkholderia cepacia TaxID=292 RepID=UPI0026DEE8D2|nr:hypothetical protein [Burkholderia cepacia]MDO5943381.1 hypothetical protein [Burkholderia cepacia]
MKAEQDNSKDGTVRRITLRLNQEQCDIIDEISKDEGFEHDTKAVLYALYLYKYGKKLPDALLNQSQKINDLATGLNGVKQTIQRKILGDNDNHLLNIDNSEKLDKILALLEGKSLGDK